MNYRNAKILTGLAVFNLLGNPIPGARAEEFVSAPELDFADPGNPDRRIWTDLLRFAMQSGRSANRVSDLVASSAGVFAGFANPKLTDQQRYVNGQIEIAKLEILLATHVRLIPRDLQAWMRAELAEVRKNLQELRSIEKTRLKTSPQRVRRAQIIADSVALGQRTQWITQTVKGLTHAN